jgi:hypothetical protein
MNQRAYEYIQETLEPVFERHDWYQHNKATEDDMPTEIFNAVYDLVMHPIHKKYLSDDDSVNNPAHYTQGGIETIDILKQKLNADEFKGFLKGNVIKYITRSTHKGNELEDLKKAQWYISKAIETLEG